MRRSNKDPFTLPRGSMGPHLLSNQAVAPASWLSTAQRRSMGPSSSGVPNCRRSHSAPVHCKLGSSYWLWNHVSQGELDSVLCWSYSGGQAEGRGGLIDNSLPLGLYTLVPPYRWKGWGTGLDGWLCVPNVPNGYSEYTPLLESMGGVLQHAPTENAIVLLGDFSAHIGNDSLTWRGGIGRRQLQFRSGRAPDLNVCSDVGLLCLSQIVNN